MKEILKKNVENMIYEIRGKQVILVSDVASLYGVQTKVMNQMVKRHLDLFSTEDYFQLTEEEYTNLRSQIVTSSNHLKHGGRRYLPYVFTKQGVEILFRFLRTKVDSQMNLEIMNAFSARERTMIKSRREPLKNKVKIEDMIYEIRGKQVMLDQDLAKIYQCKNGTKTINLAVKRHINKFPERFMFQLTEEEFINLRFQIETANQTLMKSSMMRTLPYAFTEQGVAMLATVLRTSVADEVSIGIMDAFVLMRQYISSNDYEKRLACVETKLIDYDIKLKKLFDQFDSKVNHHIFFQGQIYDAYSKLVDILNTATSEIIIIDNYVDKNFLDIISKVDVPITLITHPKTCLTKTDINKYRKQYHNLTIHYCSAFHDRFMILDQKILYHCGASFKDLGKKCFAINKIEDLKILKRLLCNVSKIT